MYTSRCFSVAVTFKCYLSNTNTSSHWQEWMAGTVAGVGATPAPTAVVSAGSWSHIAAWSRTSRRPAILVTRVPPTDGAVLWTILCLFFQPSWRCNDCLHSTCMWGQFCNANIWFWFHINLFWIANFVYIYYTLLSSWWIRDRYVLLAELRQKCRCNWMTH